MPVLWNYDLKRGVPFEMALRSVLPEVVISTLIYRWDHSKRSDVDIDCESLDSLYYSISRVLKNDDKNIMKKSNLHNFPLYFQWDIIVRQSSLINAYNLPHYGYEPWKSLHNFDEIYEKKFGKLLVIVTQSYSTTWIFISSVVRNLFLFYGSTD